MHTDDDAHRERDVRVKSRLSLSPRARASRGLRCTHTLRSRARVTYISMRGYKYTQPVASLCRRSIPRERLGDELISNRSLLAAPSSLCYTRFFSVNFRLRVNGMFFLFFFNFVRGREEVNNREDDRKEFYGFLGG